MLTKAQIAAASPTLDETDIQMLATVIRNGATYKANPVMYPELEGKISDTDGTVKAQMLNATLDLLEALGPGEVELSGGNEGLRYSQTREREALVNYALSVIYDIQLTAVVNPTRVTGNFGVGQREIDPDFFV